ncbi:MAG: hypothetical protein HRU34_22800 [Richelia sp.]|nr:hypothetical protein [Richelia sp.]
MPSRGIKTLSKPNKHSYPHQAPPNLAKRSPASILFGDAPPVPPKGRWRSHLTIKTYLRIMYNNL